MKNLNFKAALHEVAAVVNPVGAILARVKRRNREHKLKLKPR